MAFTVKTACGCFIGNGREHNEDNFYFNKKHLPQINKGLRTPIYFETTTQEPEVLAVFDGMGGEAHGEEAACKACEVFAEEVKRDAELVVQGKEFLCTTCHRANKVVADTTGGTTVAAIYIWQDEVYACNVGDSKIFRIRDNQMLQISQDHTDEKILTAMGIQKKPVLLQYLGVPETEMVLEPSISKGEIQTGDIYVICSDGVTDYLAVQELYEVIKKTDDVKRAVETVLRRVDENDGLDNATIIIAKLM